MEIKGTVKAVRKDKKAILVDEDWYSGFKELDCKPGDKVEIEFVKNEVNDRIYRNYSKVEIVESSPKSSQQHQATELTEKTASMLTSYAKDIVISLIATGMVSNSKDIEETMNDVVEAIVNAYRKIKISL